MKKPADWESEFKLWSRYEDIAMHFNDLMMRWRLQAMGGLATLVTVSGFVVGDIETFQTRYRGILILSGMLFCVWCGVAVIDLFYYRRLLRGAVDEIEALEKLSESIKLSTRIESVSERTGSWAPWVFYILGLIPLIAIFSWAGCQLSRGPEDAKKPSGAPVSSVVVTVAAPKSATVEVKKGRP